MNRSDWERERDRLEAARAAADNRLDEIQRDDTRDLGLIIEGIGIGTLFMGSGPVAAVVGGVLTVIGAVWTGYCKYKEIKRSKELKVEQQRLANEAKWLSVDGRRFMRHTESIIHRRERESRVRDEVATNEEEARDTEQDDEQQGGQSRGMQAY